MIKNRQISSLINAIKNKKHARIIVLTGARQVGKTTLIKRFFKDYEYISVEDPVNRSNYTSLTSAEWQHFYPKAALDEVQKEPMLIESIKATYDQYDDVQYILLGSSQLLLLQKVRESLAGRCVIFDMYPLTLPELAGSSWTDEPKSSVLQEMLASPLNPCSFLPSFLLDKRQTIKKQSWNHYLKFGAYPALVDESMRDDDRYMWLKNYVRTYLERDIRDLADFRSLDPFVKLQHIMAIQTAQVINASSIAVKIGTSSKTVQRYIEYLNIGYQTITLPAWYRNRGKRLSKAPKLHYLDNGVLQAVLKKRGGITGNEFESLVIAEIYKQAKNSMIEASFYHLRTQDGREVDLLVELEEGYFAFEIKMTDKVSKTDARHLKNLDEILDKPLLNSFVLSNDHKTQQLGDKIIAVNANMFLG